MIKRNFIPQLINDQSDNSVCPMKPKFVHRRICVSELLVSVGKIVFEVWLCFIRLWFPHAFVYAASKISVS